MGEIVAGATPTKLTRALVDGQPVKVRRNSYYPDDRRASAMFRPVDRKDLTVSQRLRAAEKYDREGRARGERMGPLGQIGLEVLRALYFIVDYRTGRLEPSIDYICSKVKRSRAAVVRALSRLKNHGFLDWVRRAEPVDEAEGQRGPQIRQIANAYALLIPDKARQLLRALRGPPAPPCEEDRQAAALAETRAMLESLSLAEFADATVENASLREALARVGEALDVSNANSLKRQNPATQG